MSKERLIEFLDAQNFTVAEGTAYAQLTMNPDILFTEGNNIKAVVIRESADSLSVQIIQRFSQSKRIPGKTLELFFLFPSKPTAAILKECKLYGLGIYYIGNKDQIEIFAESRKRQGRRNKSAIPAHNIFFCSKQDILERKVAKELIDENRDSLRVPIFPILVEDEQDYSSNILKLRKIIIRCMDGSDFVLIVLNGEKRPIIDWEVRRALEYFDSGDIWFYVKGDKQTKEAYLELLNIATEHGIKWIEFYDDRDFKKKVYKRLMLVIKKLHDKYDVPFLEDEEDED